jgi:hypothetical protein
MSLYDDAVFISSLEGAAGKNGKIYNLKPEEKGLVDTELVTDGTFQDGVTDWSTQTDGPSAITAQTDKTIRFSSTSDSTNNYSRIRQDDVFTAGKKYRVVIDVDVLEGGVKFGHGSNNLAIGHTDNTSAHDPSGKYVFYFEAEDDDIVIARHVQTIDSVQQAYEFFLRSVSVKEVSQMPADFELIRGSNEAATRINPEGYVEKGRKNMMRYSGQFDHSSWYMSGTESIAGGHTSYSGRKNAYKVVFGTNNNYLFGSDKSLITTTNNENWTWSVYAKAEGTSTLHLGIWTPAAGSDPEIAHGRAVFTLSGDGAVFSVSDNDTAAGTVPIGKIEKMDSSGWYRCSVTNSSNMTGQRPRIQARNAAGEQNSGGTIYIADSQFEMGLVPTAYMESTTFEGVGGVRENEPRFDYSYDVKGCPALLLEPQRTNEIRYSEDFRQSYWTNNAMTVTQNHTTSPEGLKNATKIVANTSSVDHHLSSTQSWGTADQWLNGSVFVKPEGHTFFHLSLGASRLRATFELTGSGSVVADSVAWSTTNFYQSGDNNNDATKYDPDAKIEQLENGWYRCQIFGEYKGTGDDAEDSYLRFSSSPTHTAGTSPHVFSGAGNNTDGVVIWGAQVEDNAQFATSYIPNYGTTNGVTRAFEQTGPLYISDYCDGKDVTCFVEFADNVNLIRDDSTPNVKFGGDPSTLGAFRVYRPSQSNFRRLFIYASNNENASKTHNTGSSPAAQSTDLSTPKVVFKRVYDTGRIKIFKNGSEIYDFVDLDFDIINRIDLSGKGASTKIKNVMVFDRVLTDAECVSLTS